jgi:hypothetical protein
MTIRRNTPALDSLVHMLGQLESGGFAARPELPEREALKVGYLAASGRPLLKQGRGLGLAFVRYAKVELSRQTRAGRFDADALLAAGCEGLKSHVLLRMREGGNDVDFRALKPSTIARKEARGASHPSTPTLDTEDLYNALKSARWTVDRGR